MMDKLSKYLFDIQHSISLVENFTQNIKLFEDYQNDIKTQSAVERQLAIIGEVVNKLYKEYPHHVPSSAKKMIDFRNRLIHSYDNIDNSIVWVILKKHIPILKTEIDAFINL